MFDAHTINLALIDYTLSAYAKVCLYTGHIELASLPSSRPYEPLILFGSRLPEYSSSRFVGNNLGLVTLVAL